jgi:hypothetical protein
VGCGESIFGAARGLRMRQFLDGLRGQNPQWGDRLLKPLLAYLLTAREVGGGDLDLNIILLIIAIRTIEHPDFDKFSAAELLGEGAVFPTLGVNTQSLAESSGIPLETVRRKLVKLVRRGWIVQRGRNLHFTSEGYKELTAVREAREVLAFKYYKIFKGEAENMSKPTSPFESND